MLPTSPSWFLAPHWPLIGLAFAIFAVLAMRKAKAGPYDIATELLIVIPGYLLYTTVRGMVAGREAEAFGRAVSVMHVERAMGIFWETDLQGQILDNKLLIDLANSTYAWAHWPVIITVAVWLFFQHRNAYPMFRNAFLISGAIALVVYATLPVAPPRFMPAWGFVDTVAVHSGYEVFQPPAFVNQYAAIPSLHFGWNLLASIAIVRYASALPVKVLGVLMPIAMFLSVVSTGNHFILDALAGATVALLALGAAAALRSLVQRMDYGSGSGGGALVTRLA